MTRLKLVAIGLGADADPFEPPHIRMSVETAPRYVGGRVILRPELLHVHDENGIPMSFGHLPELFALRQSSMRTAGTRPILRCLVNLAVRSIFHIVVIRAIDPSPFASNLQYLVQACICPDERSHSI